MRPLPPSATAAPARPPRRRVPLVLAALLAVVAASCGTDSPDPATRLSAAVDATFDGAFAYTLTLDADRAALDALGDAAGGAAGFLAGFGLAGVKDAEGNLSVDLALTEDGDPLFRLLSFGDDAFYLNLGLDEFLGLAGAGEFDPRDELAPALDALGLGPEVTTAVLDLVDGDWVGVEGELDAERIRELLGADTVGGSDDEAEEATGELLGEDLAAFVDRFVTVDEATEVDDDAERFDVRFELRAFLRATSELSARLGGAEQADALADLEADLEDLPEAIPGSATVVDDHVTELSFEVSEDEAAGSVRVVLALSDFDDVAALEPPEGATVLSDEQFTDAVERLTALTGGR